MFASRRRKPVRQRRNLSHMLSDSDGQSRKGEIKEAKYITKKKNYHEAERRSLLLKEAKHTSITRLKLVKTQRAWSDRRPGSGVICRMKDRTAAEVENREPRSHARSGVDDERGFIEDKMKPHAEDAGSR